MHYILKLKCPEVMLIIAIIIDLIFTVFKIYCSKVLSKGSWSDYNNITNTKIWQHFFLIIKFHIGVPLTITTFLLVSLSSS